MKLTPFVATSFLAISMCGLASRHPPSATAPSLGDLARQLRLQREKAKARAVFTNDNLPARPQQEGPTAATSMSSAPTTPSIEPGKPQTVEQGKPETAPAAEVHNEKYYRTKMRELQAQLDLHKRQLQILQQKESQNQMQFYPDPNKTLIQEYTRSDINKEVSEIDKKKQQIADDERAIQDL